MIEDTIALIIKDIEKLKEKLKEIKKDIKYEEKIEDDRYEDLKRGAKEMKAQVKDFEDDALRDLTDQESYLKLKEMKMKAEEDIAHANQKLFESLGKLPPKPFDLNVEMEAGPARVQIVPDMRVYVNGKEEKRRA
ncbi:hypothetical protein HOE67_02115 [Candidatus Peregrinibacteria bacterium]|jgi:hypothetical protein|nr:hypothetical protein [Candidatus Peregrinibacteria bacterium]MBT4055884.1 hypothetical protein [Candidatus Peregrinibacteria bacterium]